MRLAPTFTVFSLALAACSDGGAPKPDSGMRDIGFSRPIAPLKANQEMAEDEWVELGPADLSCLNTPANDVASTVEVTIPTKVTDFQTGNDVPSTAVTVFANQDADSPFNPAVTGGSDGAVTVTIPAGTKRFGWKMVNPSRALDTLLLNQTLDSPSMPNQPKDEIQSVSTATAATLPALIGVTRTLGTGILAGAMRDCAGKEMSNFIATVSSTQGTVTHLDGVDTYYFSPAVSLPVRHGQQAHSSKNGLFMAIEMQPAPIAYVQIWGYPTQADLDTDRLTLVGELKTKVIADTVITGSYEPLRAN